MFCNNCVEDRISNRMRKCPNCAKAFDKMDVMTAHMWKIHLTLQLTMSNSPWITVSCMASRVYQTGNGLLSAFSEGSPKKQWLCIAGFDHDGPHYLLYTSHLHFLALQVHWLPYQFGYGVVEIEIYHCNDSSSASANNDLLILWIIY